MTPTVHGNTLVGPTATDIPDKEGTNTTRQGLDEVAAKAALSVEGLPMRQVITSFAGLRAHEDGSEFIVEEVADAPGIFRLRGHGIAGTVQRPGCGQASGKTGDGKAASGEKGDVH